MLRQLVSPRPGADREPATAAAAAGAAADADGGNGTAGAVVATTQRSRKRQRAPPAGASSHGGLGGGGSDAGGSGGGAGGLPLLASLGAQAGAWDVRARMPSPDMYPRLVGKRLLTQPQASSLDALWGLLSGPVASGATASSAAALPVSVSVKEETARLQHGLMRGASDPVLARRLCGLLQAAVEPDLWWQLDYKQQRQLMVFMRSNLPLAVAACNAWAEEGQRRTAELQQELVGTGPAQQQPQVPAGCELPASVVMPGYSEPPTAAAEAGSAAAPGASELQMGRFMQELQRQLAAPHIPVASELPAAGSGDASSSSSSSGVGAAGTCDSAGAAASASTLEEVLQDCQQVLMPDALRQAALGRLRSAAHAAQQWLPPPLSKQDEEALLDLLLPPESQPQPPPQEQAQLQPQPHFPPQPEEQEEEGGEQQRPRRRRLNEVP